MVSKLTKTQEEMISKMGSEHNVRVSELRMVLIKGINAARYPLTMTEMSDICRWYIGSKKDTVQERIAPTYHNRLVMYAERNRMRQQKKGDYEDRSLEMI